MSNPVVPVIKKNGNVRLCGGFKQTINQIMPVQQYPPPRIDDIFVSLRAGQKFSKIDLQQAYLQIEMKEESNKLPTISLLFGVASTPVTSHGSDLDMIISGTTD